eukprot:6608749-Prymnesium_polylepis.1
MDCPLVSLDHTILGSTLDDSIGEVRAPSPPLAPHTRPPRPMSCRRAPNSAACAPTHRLPTTCAAYPAACAAHPYAPPATVPQRAPPALVASGVRQDSAVARHPADPRRPSP